jgi:hypothetical protein
MKSQTTQVDVCVKVEAPVIDGRLVGRVVFCVCVCANSSRWSLDCVLVDVESCHYTLHFTP